MPRRDEKLQSRIISTLFLPDALRFGAPPAEPDTFAGIPLFALPVKPYYGGIDKQNVRPSAVA